MEEERLQIETAGARQMRNEAIEVLPAVTETLILGSNELLAQELSRVSPFLPLLRENASAK